MNVGPRRKRIRRDVADQWDERDRDTIEREPGCPRCGLHDAHVCVDGIERFATAQSPGYAP